MELVELRVPLHCDGCERKLRKSLSRMIGVESVDVDHEQQKVTVMGFIEREKVMKKVKRTLKLAEFWPFGHHNIRHNNYHQHHEHKYEKHRRPRIDYWSHNTNYVDAYSHQNNHYNSHDPYVSSSKQTVHGKYGGGNTRSSYDHDYGYEQHYRPPVDDKTTTMFSEENPNACSVM
ncbi:hypothetical protein O6H91_02G147800 [Diphasiastrum complanatum]|uniref:Uncharacterized protein n=1 Tax=Diphasiastrum complanatum TaxID=34168 RepID=A0ACC2ELQ4_DIPCM|nr:hypothetical protein O6H91_Y449600 [Diphasiastrum complanatum]KAJ7567447.1 hypothetical protein O6H91_02G147800 [Diphasiastrum complanatum]